MMNFGNVGFTELIIVLLVWGLPIALLIWFIRTLTAMSTALREIAERLAGVERAVREVVNTLPPNPR